MMGELEPPAEFSGTPRFQVCRRIGHGGMGVVYEALDRERDEEIALKLLTRVDARALYRFKQEFRVLAECHHPNLVKLHELINRDAHWFFTMELIDGVSFLEHVRGDGANGSFAGDGGPARLRRLRRTLRQLGEGLSALHQANVLHRDLKPSNVLVTRDGRVVLLDFGVASELDADGVHDSWMKEVVGTIAYMSPEQAAGLPLSVASDWYSVGVMMYEALTGRLPHSGPTRGSTHRATEKLADSDTRSASWLDLVMAKQSDDPPAPAELVEGVPDDLDELCVALLSRRPEVRPSGADVLRVVAGGSRRSSLKLQYSPTSRPKTTFVGRGDYLVQLRGALDETLTGRPVVAFVHGASGIGKTALIHQFLDEVDERVDAVVLDGRCFEREFLPYKGVDSLVDALCRYLAGLSAVEVTALLPRDVAELARVFPVLSGIAAISQVPRRATGGADPQELRRRAFAALRELLARIADRRCLVMYVDDLQWGDTDGAARLAELVSPPDAPNALLVLCYRSHDTAAGPPVELLRSRLGAISYGAPGLLDLEIAPLDADEARDLASALLGDTADAATARAIVRESGGNPFFLGELARHVLHTRGDSPRVAALQDVVVSRLARVPTGSRRALEVIAVAGQPIDAAVAARAAGADDPTILDELRHSHLVQSTGDDAVVIGHDRIREAVLAQLSEAQLARHHADIARALESSGRTDPERLAVHYRAAGELERAARYALVAASHAMEALAFDRAAQLYNLALETLPLAADGRQSLLAKLGDALANAGRGPEAARAYSEAADLAAMPDALELRRRAAEQLLRAGYIDDGLVVLQRVLRTEGMRLARTPRRALWSLVLGRAQVRARGLGFRDRAPAEVDPLQRARIDTCWSVSVGLGLVDPIRAAAFQTRHLLLSLRYGDTHRVSRAIAAEVAYRSTGGAATHQQTARLVRASEAIAERTGGPYELAFSTLSSGMAAYFEGRWPRAHELTVRAEAMFREHCPGVIWEINSARIFALWSLCYRGDLGELARLVPLYLQDARNRGDLYMATSIETGLPNLLWLARDNPEAARNQVAAGMRGWSQEGFHAQHYWKLLALSHADIYAGDPHSAWSRVTSAWRQLRAAMLLRVEVVRIETLYLRGRAAIASAPWASRTERSKLLRSAESDVRRLGKQRAAWAEPIAWLLRGGLAAVRDDAAGACDALATAEHACDDVAMRLHAAAARRRRGELLGGSEGGELIARADAWMSEHGVHEPERMARLLVPG